MGGEVLGSDWCREGVFCGQPVVPVVLDSSCSSLLSSSADLAMVVARYVADGGGYVGLPGGGITSHAGWNVQSGNAGMDWSR